MSSAVLVRRIRTLRMLARTALTPEQAAIYRARVELALGYIARRQAANNPVIWR